MISFLRFFAIFFVHFGLISLRHSFLHFDAAAAAAAERHFSPPAFRCHYSIYYSAVHPPSAFIHSEAAVTKECDALRPSEPAITCPPECRCFSLAHSLSHHAQLFFARLNLSSSFASPFAKTRMTISGSSEAPQAAGRGLPVPFISAVASDAHTGSAPLRAATTPRCSYRYI